MTSLKKKMHWMIKIIPLSGEKKKAQSNEKNAVYKV